MRQAVEFIFDERKASEAAARILRRHGGSMPYIQLLKLLYLADRRSLGETGYTITGDRFVSMDRGPILSRVYDLIKRPADAPRTAWREHIEADGAFDVRVICDAPSERLSLYEEEVLDGVYDEFGALGPWDLVRHTHTLPEWRDPSGTSIAIDPCEIMRAEGMSEEEIASVGAQLDAERSFKAAFGE